MENLDCNSVLAQLPSHDFTVSLTTSSQVIDEAIENDPLLPGALVLHNGNLHAVISRSAFNQLVSRRWGREVVLGRPVSTVLSIRNLPSLIFPADTPVYVAARKALERDRSLQDEPVVVQHGENRWSLLDIGVLLRAQSAVLSSQIESHRVAVEAATQAEAKFRSIFENAIEGIFQTNSEGRYLNVNPALATIYGYDSPEDLVESMKDLRTLYVDPGRRAEFVRLVEQEGQVHDFESQVYRKDGSVIWVRERARAVRDENNAVVCYEGTVEDITASKRAGEEREELQRRYAEAARVAGKAEIASGILHNVGNVLNSVNVSSSFIITRLRDSKLPNLAKAAQLMQEHQEALGNFMTADERGKRLPGYLLKLSQALADEHAVMLQEILNLSKGIEHIKEIITLQQSYAKGSTVVSPLKPASLFEDALRVKLVSFERHQITVMRKFEELPEVPLDKHRVLQVLINLIGNAKEAVKERPEGQRQITLKLDMPMEPDGTYVRFQVIDNGVGIPPENLSRIFGHGFTTREDGHGFGLHSSAIAATEMGGKLTAASDGVGQGAAFTLTLPVKRKAMAA